MGEIVRWPNIPSDLLNEIAKRIDSYEDYIGLRLVHKEWNSRLPRIPSQRKFLVLSRGIGPLEARKLEEEGIYHIILLEIQDNLVRGSCFGWLIYLMMDDGAMRMLNPFNKTRLDLPPISTLPDVLAYNPDVQGKEYTLFDIIDDYIFKLERMHTHRTQVWKVVLSSPPDDVNDDFMAVAIYGPQHRLAFYKRNNRRWRDISTTKLHPEFQDVIFLQDKIYAIDWDAHLYIFDTKTKPLPTGGLHNNVLSPPAFRHMTYHVDFNKYLIGNSEDGSLLMLVRYMDDDGGGDNACEFDVFKLDKDAKEWLKIHILENYNLMVGYNSSNMILAPSFPYSNKGNDIYYTDNLMGFDPKFQDIGIFNMKDKSIKKLVSDVKFVCPPVWMLP